MQQSLTQQLVEHCARPVVPSARKRAARHLLDWLGCALIGSTSPAGLALSRFGAAYLPAAGNCFTVGAQPLGAADAAFQNGGLGNIFEMDDLHRASILHAGDVVVPAALAVAQEHGANPSRLLDAIVGGYEVALRIGTAAAANGYSAWYNSGTCGVFGSAYAAGTVMGLSPDRMVDALGQAGMLASGIWQCRLEPTYSKQLATAHAAHSGVLAARLAATGFPGPKLILEGELGFFATYYPAADQSHVMASSGSNWLIGEVSFKPWSACRHAHPAIEAAMVAASSCSHEDIERIGVHTYAAAIDFCDNPHPTTDHEARFSLQHCVGATVVEGEPQLQDFAESAREDREIAALRERVELVEDPAMTQAFPAMMGGRVRLELKDGTTIEHHVSTAKGDPENPMDEDELDAKFMRLAVASGICEENADAARRAILGLPEAAHLDGLNLALANLSPAPKPTAQQ